MQTKKQHNTNLKLSDFHEKVMHQFDALADRRDKYIKMSSYYYNDLVNFFKFNIPEKSSIVEIGCGTGELISKLEPSRGLGIDLSLKSLEIARLKYPKLSFEQMNAEEITSNEKFDYVILSDTLSYLEDIQGAFMQIKKITTNNSRIILTYHNFLWQPLFSIAEFLKIKTPYVRSNWLNGYDVVNFLELSGYDVIKKGQRLLFPKYIPIFSWLVNKYIANLPIINRLCLTGYIIARPKFNIEYKPSVSVIIPCRNERGNVEDAVIRTPAMGSHTEIIFVEGGSSDGTMDEIKRVCEKYSGQIDLKYMIQEGRGKGDAVRKGFSAAKGDILMILDADLTVPPEDLPKFYNAIADNVGEYINGSRLVYTMEKKAMRPLNMLANKFFSTAFSWLLNQRFKDTLCGTKVISRKNWDRLVANRKYFGDFDPFGDFDMIFGSAKLNLKIVEIPIRYKMRTYGETNISRFRHGWLLLKMVVFAMNKIKFI